MRGLIVAAMVGATCGIAMGQGLEPASISPGSRGTGAQETSRIEALKAVEDTDRDGLNDALESALLARFVPEVMVSANDCSALPGEFLPNTATPYVLADNGTIYGQATPLRESAASVPPASGAERRVELHYYFLWRKDCGRAGHALDAEHVSAIVEGSGVDPQHWRAAYWYAAAHEDTVCDASQVTRAETLDAEEHGPRVWVSHGKHGSFLNRELCRRGCGGDRCESMRKMTVRSLLNLGEPGVPMNGATWAVWTQWPLAAKMQRTDFTPERMARLRRLPHTDVAWAEPSKRPAANTIGGANAGVDGAMAGAASTTAALASSSRATNTALVISNNRTAAALDAAAQSTGKALNKSANGVKDAMGNAWKHTGGAMAPRHGEPNQVVQ